MITGHLTAAPVLGNPNLPQLRHFIRSPVSLDGDALLGTFPHLVCRLNRDRIEIELDPSVDRALDFFAAAQALRDTHLLSALLTELESVTPTHRLLTSGVAEELHELYHDDLQEDIGHAAGIDRDLLSDEEYREALKALHLPVLEPGMYDPTVTRPEPWPTQRPAGCPDWLWNAAQATVKAARAATLPEFPSGFQFFFPRYLRTADDRLPALHDDLMQGGGSDVTTPDELRQLTRYAARGRRVWTLLEDLEATCQGRAREARRC